MTFSAKLKRPSGARKRRIGTARPTGAAMLALALHLGAGCSKGGYPGGSHDAAVHDAHGPSQDAAALPDLAATDLAGVVDLRAPADFAAPADFSVRPDLAASMDLATPIDLAVPADMASGSITGGPCLSGGRGATALRVHWTASGSTAVVNYEVMGLPDKSRWKVSAYGGIGFTPQFVDPFLGSGGLGLDGSDFIDIELSTVGIHNINSITLAILGRSYATTTDGSFNWMTFTGSGTTAIDYVSNVAPYRWYPADATTDIAPGDGGVLMRVKAGGSSGSLVVNRLELCIDAS